ncbi:MAG: chemotaxis protein CheB, partial [Patescibacteria group bacterium]|nr:chemotaxis protein CheB [Patescibacteria group bacterium]
DSEQTDDSQQGALPAERALPAEGAPSADEVQPATEDEGGPSGDLGFGVVGVGASAGGLEAMEQFLQHLPADLGVALIFVQHLSPKHVSNLTSILPRSTKMAVCEAVDGMQIERDNVYVIPPDRDLAVLHGALQLFERPKSHARHMPVDYLFRSLAQDQGPRAVGVVLSGTGSDGSEGLRAIKAEGGVTFAQDEESAKYDGMPHAAAATGQVDFVLPPAEIAEEISRVVRHPHVCRPVVKREESPLGAPEALQKIFVLLRHATGVDFSQYKQSTVERRITRRMVLNRVDSPPQYLKFLQQTPREVHALFDDMLINVTGFFREPATFESLKERGFPEITCEKGPNSPVRIWVPACSTGEEPYSMAIALLEYLAERDLHVPIQIFATDISETSIET